MTDRSEPWAERARRDVVLAGDATVWAEWVTEQFDRVAGYVRWRCGGAAELAPFRARMPRDAYEQSLAACRDRLLRERARLPVLTLE